MELVRASDELEEWVRLMNIKLNILHKSVTLKTECDMLQLLQSMPIERDTETRHTSELVGELAALNLRHRNLGIRAFDHAQYDAPPAPSPWLCFSSSKLYHSSLYNLIQLNKTIQINPGWPNQICTGY